jgi:hypothetical protein
VDGTRSFLEKVLACGLDEGTVEPADVVRHVEPMVLAQHLPKDLRAKLLAASLGAGKMDADLIVTTVGTLSLCEHVPVHLLWAVLADCGQRAVSGNVDEAARTVKTEPKVDKKPEPEKKPEPAKSSGVPTATMTGKPITTQPIGCVKREPAPAVAKAEPAKVDTTKTDIKQIDDPQPKPNVKAKAEPPKPEPKKDSKPAPLSDRDRTRTAPIVPKSEFEVDTNVGDEWANDDIVDIVEEADAVGAVVDDLPPTDWKADEETVNRFKKR